MMKKTAPGSNENGLPRNGMLQANYTTRSKNEQLPVSIEISFTRVESKGQDLRKKYAIKDECVDKQSAAQMYKGKAYREHMSTLKTLDGFLNNIKKNEAIMTGAFPRGEVFVTTKQKEQPQEGIFARTLSNVSIPSNSLYIQLLDNDPHPDGVTFKKADDAITYLRELSPVFTELEILARPSSSAGISYKEKEINDHISWHIFIKVDPSVAIHVLRDWIEYLCWKNGDGYIALSSSGAQLERCTFDMAVFSPERLIFEAKPELKDGITRKKYESAYQAGRELLLHDITDINTQHIFELKKDAKRATDEKAEQIRKSFIDAKALEHWVGDPDDIDDYSYSIAQRLCERELSLDTQIEHETGEILTIREMCDDHGVYNNTALADPIEGANYGRTTAKFYYNDGKPMINSFAHGGMKYRLAKDEIYTPVKRATLPISHNFETTEFPYPTRDKMGLVTGAITNIENVAHLLERYGINIRYNETNKTIETKLPKMDKRPTADHQENFAVGQIRSLAARYKINPDQAAKFADNIGMINPYNPIIEWFESKPWDGQSRIDNLLSAIHVENGWEDARQTYVTKWLMAAAGMQKNNGELSARGVLTFCGEQNIGKTFFLQLLTGDMWQYCKDGVVIDTSNKDSIKIVISQWIAELGELDATFEKKQIAALKAFLTQNEDTLRLSYAAKESKFPRRTVVIASVNEREFLRDTTGNSRYWVLPVNGFDFNTLRSLDMQQLWAEVWFNTLKAMKDNSHTPPWFLNEQESADLTAKNQTFAESCEVTNACVTKIMSKDQLDKLSCDTALFSATEVLRALDITPNQSNSRKAVTALRYLGYEHGCKRTKRFRLQSELNGCCKIGTPQFYVEGDDF